MTGRPSWGIDALLVLMVVIWGANYSVIKRCFAEIPPQPFNALRLVVGAGTFYLAIRAARQARESGGRLSSVFYTTAPLTTRDRVDLLWLGLVGPPRVSELLCRRRRRDERLERGAHHRLDAGRDCDDLGAPRPRAHRAASLDRHRRRAGRHLLRRGPRRVVRRRAPGKATRS